MQDTFHALSQPRRREILQLLRRRAYNAAEIAAEFPDVTRPAISQHLGVLRRAGLVFESRKGTQRIYRVNSDGLHNLTDFLSSVMSHPPMAANKLSGQDCAVIQRRFSASPGRLFQFFLDPARSARWLGDPIIDPDSEGALYFFVAGRKLGGKIAEVSHPEILVIDWDGELRSESVRITLKEEEGGSVITLRHDGVMDAALWERFWVHHFIRLKSALSGFFLAENDWDWDK